MVPDLKNIKNLLSKHGLKSVYLYIERQILLTEKEIPGFFTAAMAKSIMMWMVPLLVFLVTMYMIAFKENSLVLIIFSMGIMLHPIVTIPISITVNFISHRIKKCFSKKDCLSTRWKYCFSTVSYFVIICIWQVYLTLMWENLNSEHLESNKTLTTAFAFYRFDQCTNCSAQIEANFCTLSEGETIQFNIEEYLLQIPLSTLPYFLIGMTSILVLWHFGEIYFGVAIPIFQFILGSAESTHDIQKPEEIELPPLQSHDEQENQTCETADVSDITLENQQQSHGSSTKIKKGKWFDRQTLCLILSILYIIAIGLSPLMFSRANFWNDRECKPGFYDDNNDDRILRCEGKNLHDILVRPIISSSTAGDNIFF